MIAKSWPSFLISISLVSTFGCKTSPTSKGDASLADVRTEASSFAEERAKAADLVKKMNAHQNSSAMYCRLEAQADTEILRETPETVSIGVTLNGTETIDGDWCGFYARVRMRRGYDKIILEYRENERYPQGFAAPSASNRQFSESAGHAALVMHKVNDPMAHVARVDAVQQTATNPRYAEYRVSIRSANEDGDAAFLNYVVRIGNYSPQAVTVIRAVD